MSLRRSITVACRGWQKCNSYVLPLPIATILTPCDLPNSTSARTQPAAALPASLIARIRYEQGRLDEAESLLDLPLAAHQRRYAAGLRIECLLHHGEDSCTQAERGVGPRLAGARGEPGQRAWLGPFECGGGLERARLFLNEGRIDEGAGCIRDWSALPQNIRPRPIAPGRISIGTQAFGRAYLASAEERFEDAISILSGLRHEFESVGNRHLAFRVQVHMATVRFRAKQVRRGGGLFRRYRHGIRARQHISTHSG